jgi:RNA polymerase sigma factor (sigma-70 family)
LSTLALSPVFRLVRSVYAASSDIADEELLERFLQRHDQSAFEALVRRHGPTVWTVCRRLLRNAHDAEDAFQAAFLVLVRGAASIGRRESVGGWLYGVAYRVSMKARAMAAKRRSKEAAAARSDVQPPQHGEDDSELLRIVHEELAQMPDRYRLAVLLCDVQEVPRAEAARQLGWRDGTLSGRLTRARRLLADRLRVRGITLSAAVLSGGILASGAGAVERVPPLLIRSTVDIAIQGIHQGASGAAMPTTVADLTGSVLGEITMRIKACVAAGAFLVASLFGGWCLASAGAADDTPPPKPMVKPAVKPIQIKPVQIQPVQRQPVQVGQDTPPAPRLVELKAGDDGKVRINVTRPGVRPVVAPAAPVELGEVKDLTIYTVEGKEVAREEALKKLAKGGMVAISADGKAVDAKFLRMFRDDVLVLVSPELVSPQGRIGGVVRPIRPVQPKVIPVPNVKPVPPVPPVPPVQPKEEEKK